MDTRSAAGTGEEIRCPSCARLLVLRSGPRVTPHFAHRPRQSCRQRPGRGPGPGGPLRLEQLTLFDVEGFHAPAPVPVFFYRPRLVPPASPAPATPARRRRRRAWLPRLIRRLRARVGSV